MLHPFEHVGDHQNPLAHTPAFPSCQDRKSTRLNSSHLVISYAVFCLKKKNSIVSGSKHITLNVTEVVFLTASQEFSHDATSKSSSHIASNTTNNNSPHLSRGRELISL